MKQTILTLLTVLLLGALTSLHASQPVVFWVSDPVQPGEVVLVEGANWGEAPKVELTWLQDGKAGEPAAQAAGEVQKSAVVMPLQTNASSVKFLVPKDWQPGVYAFQVDAGGAKSAPAAINAPSPWWQQGDWGKEASPGGWLRVFGRCLSLSGKATVALKGAGKALTLTPIQQDLWSLNVTLPADMAAGDYETWVHSGSGGPAGWRKAGTVKVAAHPFPPKPEVFDVTAYGANPNGGFDDSLAVQKALDAAGDNGGGANDWVLVLEVGRKDG
ncbi:MAG: hypothetical protein FJ272_15530 [Planctomycetes bacterium]|nr:hypothetical protein [Planctomycetota bacterium]